ncbi:Phospholipid/glycerol acyltransferase [Phytophthora cactorum]|nr:Phospholipid/glycerol acyltransferase [Phytophthora cactorum]
MRGTAVIFVVTQHTGYMHDIFMGAVGVDAFFVLSSFLLTMIFMKKSIKLFAENASYRKWGYTLADYFSKRFFRVYPLFALLSIALWLMPFEYKKRYYLISYYFILPAFVLAVLKLGRFWWMSFVPLYIWVIHEGLYTTRDNFYRQPLIKHLPTFVAGSMAACTFVKLEALIKATGFKFRMLHVVALRIVEAILIAAYLSVVFRGLLHWLGMPLAPATKYIMPFTSVKLSLLIVIEMVQPSTVSKIFEWIVLRYMGKISFSVYLLHVFVIFTPSIKQETKYYDKTFAVFGLVTLLATASYYLVEYPSQLFAQGLSRELDRRASYAYEKYPSDTDDSDDSETAKTSTKEPLAGSHLVRSLSLSALSIGVVSVGVGAVTLYVDAPVADLGDGQYDGGRRSEVFPEWLHDVARVPLFGAVTLASKFYLQLLNRTTVEGAELLTQQLEQRPKGTAVITVSNHSATVDDPAVLANQEYCYTKGKLLSTLFFGAKTLPVKRGAGVDHQMIQAIFDKVEEGAWVHIFPEGKIVQHEALGGRSSPRREKIGRLKWGVGKLIARATTRPIVVPVYHYNMEKLMPQDEKNRLISLIPKTNLDLGVIVGEPLSFDDLFERYADDRMAGGSPWETQEREKALYSAITRRIENALLALEKKTHRLQQ